jgi:outer membrane protein TolC
MRRWTWVLAVLLIAVTSSVSAEDKGNLSLEKCIEVAHRKSPFMEAAKQGLNALEYQYKEAWWSWMPTLKLRSMGTLIPPQEIEDPSEDDPDLSDYNLWSKTDLEAYVPLYTFGKISTLKKMAKEGVDIGRAAVRLAKAEITYQVTRAWYGAQLASELSDLIFEGEKKLKKARKRLEKLESEDSDDFDQNDMFRLRIYEADVHKHVLANRRMAKLSQSGLRAAMGLKPNAQLNLPTDNPLEVTKVELGSLEQVVEVATRHRPELEILRRKVTIQRSEVERKWADFFPDIFAAASFTVAASTVNQQNTVFSSTVFNALGGGAAIGISLTLDYPAKLARYNKAQAELLSKEAALDGEKAKLRLELEAMWREATDHKEMLKLNKRAMKAGRSLFVSNVQEYENGIDDSTSFQDVLESSVSYLVRKSEWLKSIYAFNTAVARLKRAIGGNLAVSQ